MSESFASLLSAAAAHAPASPDSAVADAAAAADVHAAAAAAAAAAERGAPPSPLPAGLLEEDGITPLRGNALYTTRAYWEHRFSREESKDWLACWADLSPLLSPLLPRLDAALLLVGSGNSRLPAELAAAGYRDVLATDYAEAVVSRMAAAAPPGVRWATADMRALPLPAASADVYLDKAAMDALLADGGDAWPGQAPPQLLAATALVMAEAWRVLRPGGLYLQVSFAPRHFRAQYLLQRDWAGAALAVKSVPVGLGYYLFILRKPGEGGAAPAAAATAEP